MTQHDFNSLILGVLGRSPEWVRVDLAAKDAGTRQRAEETLAAMIGAAVQANASSLDQPDADAASGN